MSTIMMKTMGVHIDPVVITDALTSSIFLEYAPDRSTYQTGAAYDLIVRLASEIKAFNQAATAETLELIYAYAPARIGRDNKSHRMLGDKLALLVSLEIRRFNIITLCAVLAKFLDGQPVEKPQLCRSLLYMASRRKSTKSVPGDLKSSPTGAVWWPILSDVGHASPLHHRSQVVLFLPN
ncbi:hypothetical protein M2360_005372 [Rhizobium sp. SG_E_25_P2]|uniref:hypothetical protein n=1 Tax=Rhizobium sp. SG_E_25_P2 TaxID=2879942 RepID=UPI0024734400|nr:hypothetical protein [Rhizobium sp. SG_E_25_P2]MDH6269934.1 hypothetical protein [Rhizobium sp. SG_E_25_P2]